MNKYELMVIYKPDLKDTDIKKEIDTLKSKIKDYKGEVVKEDFWGLKDLAYQIGRDTKGYYQVLEFTVDPLKVGDLSKWLSNQEKTVIRSLVVKLDK